MSLSDPEIESKWPLSSDIKKLSPFTERLG